MDSLNTLILYYLVAWYQKILFGGGNWGSQNHLHYKNINTAWLGSAEMLCYSSSKQVSNSSPYEGKLVIYVGKNDQLKEKSLFSNEKECLFNDKWQWSTDFRVWGKQGMVEIVTSQKLTWKRYLLLDPTQLFQEMSLMVARSSCASVLPKNLAFGVRFPSFIYFCQLMTVI